MKKTYTQPAVDVEMVMVENGIAVSPTAYGEAGYAGQTSDYNDVDFDL